MSVSGARAAVEINLEEFEKRLRAAGAQQAGAEDPLSELARLVETARPASAEPPRPPAPAPTRAPVSTPRPALEGAPTDRSLGLRPAIDEASEPMFEDEAETPNVDADDIAEFRAASPAPERASRAWLLSVSALAIAGVAMLGGVFVFRGGLPSLPGLPKTPPFIVAAQGPTKVQPPSDATVATPGDSSGALMKDSNPSAPVKVVTSEEQPVDLAATAAAAKPPAPDASAGPATSPPAADSTMKGTLDTPVVVATTTAPAPPLASQFPDPKPVRTMSLRPDGTPIPASASSAPASAAEPARAAPAPKPAPLAKAAEPATPQPSTPKIDLPTKLSGKSSARIVVAKTDTTAPADGGATETAKPEKPAKPTKAHEAAAEPTAPAAAEPADTAATASAGWAVQLAAPRSEAEAKATAAKLNAKYASALGGAPIGVHKATVKGETIYRLRVAGLSKSDAAALCARLKGEGGECFIAK